MDKEMPGCGFMYIDVRKDGSTYDTQNINININAIIKIVKREVSFGGGNSFFPYEMVLNNGETLQIDDENMNRLMDRGFVG